MEVLLLRLKWDLTHEGLVGVNIQQLLATALLPCDIYHNCNFTLIWAIIWLLSFFPTPDCKPEKAGPEAGFAHQCISVLTFSEHLFNLWTDEWRHWCWLFKLPIVFSPLNVCSKNPNSNDHLLLMKWTVGGGKNCSDLFSAARQISTGLRRSSAFSLPADRQWCWGCDLLAFHAASMLPAWPLKLVGLSSPTNILTCPHAKTAPAGLVSFASEGIKILLSKSSPSQTSFAIWAQHHFNMMFLAFPEVCVPGRWAILNLPL